MSPRALLLLFLAAGVWAAVQGDAALAQQPQAQKPPAKKDQRLYYDQYEPGQVRRGRAQSCLRDESEIGAYCVKFCKKGYAMVPDSNPLRCRGIDPLPPGQLPGPIHRDVGEQQPKLPGQPTTPRPPSGGV